MDGWIRLDGFVEALRLALLVEEAVLVLAGDQEVELEVAPRELHAAGYGRPLAEDDGVAVRGAVGQRVAADDVALQHVAETLLITAHTARFAHSPHNLGIQPLAAGLGVVRQNVNAIAGAYGDKAPEFPFGL